MKTPEPILFRRKHGIYSTPVPLAQRMAKLLGVKPPATVLDPACGRGELLIAVAKHIGTKGITFIGVDTNPKLLGECSARLRELGASFRLMRGDFLSIPTTRLAASDGFLYVTMNPPFRGYGEMSETDRARLVSQVSTLQARFNTAHAFVSRVVRDLPAKRVVALLPGNWLSAAYNDLQDVVQGKSGRWIPLPDNLFPDVTTTLGLLIAKSPGPRGPFKWSQTRGAGLLDAKGQSRVRQGVATGADSTFVAIAGLQPPCGKVVSAARGRDIGKEKPREQLPRIWIPTEPPAETKHAMDWLPQNLQTRLEERYHSRKRGKPSLSFHESAPAWFLGTPKLIVPEVCVKMKVLEDANGVIFPLHSTIAIEARTRGRMRRISFALKSRYAWRWLVKKSPKMVGSSLRITAPRLRELVLALERKGMV